MDYSQFMSDLDGASLFDLYRLNAAICKEMENPKRIAEVKKMMKQGDIISYFEGSENRLIQAEVIELKRTRVLVKNRHDMKQWNIPFYMVNVDEVATDIQYSTTAKGMNRNEIRIGDLVGYSTVKSFQLLLSSLLSRIFLQQRHVYKRHFFYDRQ
jgi:hypothetical protein